MTRAAAKFAVRQALERNTAKAIANRFVAAADRRGEAFIQRNRGTKTLRPSQGCDAMRSTYAIDVCDRRHAIDVVRSTAGDDGRRSMNGDRRAALYGRRTPLS
ncbi:MAG: hypothetical protein QM766_01575 [Burkholderiaceae bacterium]